MVTLAEWFQHKISVEKSIIIREPYGIRKQSKTVPPENILDQIIIGLEKLLKERR